MKLKGLLILLASILATSGGAYANNDHREHGKDKSLPPGLEKKHDQGKPLPPGWQKKLSKGDILDQDIFDRGRVVAPLGKDGSISIEVDGTVVKLYENTREIIDILGR